MSVYIATFFSHFGAMAFKKRCEEAGFPAKIMPVPRALSSSCGTCVKFTGEDAAAEEMPEQMLENILENILEWDSDETEQVVKAAEDGTFVCIWKAEE